MKYKKSNKKGITLLNIFLLFLLIISLVIFLISLYFLYLNLPGKPQSLEIETQNFDNGSSNTIQFYSNMKFNHNECKYLLTLFDTRHLKEEVLFAQKG